MFFTKSEMSFSFLSAFYAFLFEITVRFLTVTCYSRIEGREILLLIYRLGRRVKVWQACSRSCYIGILYKARARHT